MDATGLREVALKAIGKNVSSEPENPVFDSLDKLEIITALHDTFGDGVAQVDDLDDFSDLESLTAILKAHGVIN
jgi:acyl carrier protein